jgi:hypothetical protein
MIREFTPHLNPLPLAWERRTEQLVTITLRGHVVASPQKEERGRVRS